MGAPFGGAPSKAKRMANVPAADLAARLVARDPSVTRHLVRRWLVEEGLSPLRVKSRQAQLSDAVARTDPVQVKRLLDAWSSPAVATTWYGEPAGELQAVDDAETSRQAHAVVERLRAQAVTSTADALAAMREAYNADLVPAGNADEEVPLRRRGAPVVAVGADEPAAPVRMAPFIDVTRALVEVLEEPLTLPTCGPIVMSPPRLVAPLPPAAQPPFDPTATGPFTMMPTTSTLRRTTSEPVHAFSDQPHVWHTVSAWPAFMGQRRVTRMRRLMVQSVFLPWLTTVVDRAAAHFAAIAALTNAEVHEALGMHVRLIVAPAADAGLAALDTLVSVVAQPTREELDELLLEHMRDALNNVPNAVTSSEAARERYWRTRQMLAAFADANMKATYASHEGLLDYADRPGNPERLRVLVRDAWLTGAADANERSYATGRLRPVIDSDDRVRADYASLLNAALSRAFQSAARAAVATLRQSLDDAPRMRTVLLAASSVALLIALRAMVRTGADRAWLASMEALGVGRPLNVPTRADFDVARDRMRAWWRPDATPAALHIGVYHTAPPQTLGATPPLVRHRDGDGALVLRAHIHAPDVWTNAAQALNARLSYVWHVDGAPRAAGQELRMPAGDVVTGAYACETSLTTIGGGVIARGVSALMHVRRERHCVRCGSWYDPTANAREACRWAVDVGYAQRDPVLSRPAAGRDHVAPPSRAEFDSVVRTAVNLTTFGAADLAAHMDEAQRQRERAGIDGAGNVDAWRDYEAARGAVTMRTLMDALRKERDPDQRRQLRGEIEGQVSTLRQGNAPADIVLRVALERALIEDALRSEEAAIDWRSQTNATAKRRRSDEPTDGTLSSAPHLSMTPPPRAVIGRGPAAASHRRLLGHPDDAPEAGDRRWMSGGVTANEVALGMLGRLSETLVTYVGAHDDGSVMPDALRAMIGFDRPATEADMRDADAGRRVWLDVARTSLRVESYGEDAATLTALSDAARQLPQNALWLQRQIALYNERLFAPAGERQR